MAMTSLTDNMQTLVHNVRTSLMERRVALDALAGETRDALQSYRTEQQSRAQALRERAGEVRARLAAQREEQAFASRGRCNGFMADNEQRRVSVSELRTEVHSRVKRHGMERQEAADQQRARLAAEVRALKSAVRDIVASVNASVRELSRVRQVAGDDLHKTLAGARASLAEAVGEFGDDLKKDIHRMRELWRGLTRSPAQRESSTDIPRAGAASETEKEAHEYIEVDEHDVFAVISAHPQGIRLVDVGQALGVAWRNLVGLARALVDEGRVKKVDNLYYPKQERRGYGAPPR